MAGIGVKLHKIYDKQTLTTNLAGFGYSTVMTIAPMLVIIGAIILMQILLDVASTGYASRELYACTVLYIFVFALLTASPFNSVLSRYISDVIYEERYADIIPCYYTGLAVNMILSCLVGIPFCIREHIVGEVEIGFVFAGYCGYAALVFVFYTMLYLSICKDYKKISLFFTIGMVFAVLLSLILTKLFSVAVSYSMLISLDAGFLLTGVLEYALLNNYFRENSGKYGDVFAYFKKFWPLIGTNVVYTMGLYMHNFVLWSTDMHIVVAKSFVCMPPYDMATCIAMFTNISSSVIFLTRIEMYFHARYKAYSEAVIGGRLSDIEIAKSRMFRQLSEELFNLVRVQFIVTVVAYFVCVIFLPQYGYGGSVMRIYPCLAVGYFILFIMYAVIIFLYYFNDVRGALMVAGVFLLITLFGTVIAVHLADIWYGVGLVAGSFAGFSLGYFRLRYLERNLDIHIFCNGNLMKTTTGKKPDGKVYDRAAVKEIKEEGTV